MAFTTSRPRPLTSAALLVAIVGGLVSASASAGPNPWVRFIATELETEASPLPTTPASTIDALLQAKIYASNNGQYWAAEVITLQGATTNRAAISGTRTGIDFALARGQTIPGLAVAFEAAAVGLDTAVLVNSAGDVSISGNLSGPAATDEAIVLYRRSSGDFGFVAREGSPIPGLAGENFGSGLDQRSITEDGRVLFRDGATAGALPASQDEFLFLGGVGGVGFTSIVQGGVVVPSGQSIQPDVVMPDIELGYGVSDDGQNYITRGILQRAAPNVVAIRNGAVVLEQGQTLPGAGSPTPPLSTALAITDAGMGPGGDWYVAGRALPTGTGEPTAPWLIFNNRIIYSGDVDFPGGLPGERVNNLNGISVTTRGDLFFSVSTVPQLGFSRTVGIVVPVVGAPIVAYQSGTPIDFNRNNDPSDDSWFISTVFSAVMADDGTIYLITRYSTVGDVIGYIPVTLPTGSCGPADIAATDGSPGSDNAVDNGDFQLFFTSFFSADCSVTCGVLPVTPCNSADIAATDGSPGPDGCVDNGDFSLFFTSFFAGCP